MAKAKSTAIMSENDIRVDGVVYQEGVRHVLHSDWRRIGLRGSRGSRGCVGVEPRMRRKGTLRGPWIRVGARLIC